MVIFHSYVSLPEGTTILPKWSRRYCHCSWSMLEHCSRHPELSCPSSPPAPFEVPGNIHPRRWLLKATAKKTAVYIIYIYIYIPFVGQTNICFKFEIFLSVKKHIHWSWLSLAAVVVSLLPQWSLTCWFVEDIGQCPFFLAWYFRKLTQINLKWFEAPEYPSGNQTWQWKIFIYNFIYIYIV